MSEFYKNLYISLVNYNKKFKSNHWLYNNNKKKNLFQEKNLFNFRRNGLSYGLDDQFYSKNQAIKFFNFLTKEYSAKFIFSLLEKKNIGNPKKYILKKNKYFTAHELVHIKHLLDFKDNVKLKKNDIVCEIGPGYGSLISKIIKIYNCKVVLIDLPESNFLSHYYLKKIFPQKKILVSSKIKKKLSLNDIKKNDIFILCPWDNLPNIKIDLFINSRSMMEMTYETINFYFKLIKKKIKKNGYFLCINRYYKDTVGYPIELNKYPFDNYWNVIVSKKSWKQKHIHYLLLKRTRHHLNDIKKELKKIKLNYLEIKKKDKFFWRRILPIPLYKLYKFAKYKIS